MSSLLQFRGEVGSKGVCLIGYDKKYDEFSSKESFLYKSTDAPLYKFWRKPCGMWGCWVLFRINGVKEAPDLSVPIKFTKIPVGAIKLTDDEAQAYWKSE